MEGKWISSSNNKELRSRKCMYNQQPWDFGNWNGNFKKKTWFSSQKNTWDLCICVSMEMRHHQVSLGMERCKNWSSKRNHGWMSDSGKIWQILANDPPDFLEDLPESTNDFHGHNFVTPHKKPLIKPLTFSHLAVLSPLKPWTNHQEIKNQKKHVSKPVFHPSYSASLKVASCSSALRMTCVGVFPPRSSSCVPWHRGKMEECGVLCQQNASKNRDFMGISQSIMYIQASSIVSWP